MGRRTNILRAAAPLISCLKSPVSFRDQPPFWTHSSKSWRLSNSCTSIRGKDCAGGAESSSASVLFMLSLFAMHRSLLVDGPSWHFCYRYRRPPPLMWLLFWLLSAMSSSVRLLSCTWTLILLVSPFTSIYCLLSPPSPQLVCGHQCSTDSLFICY